MGEALGGLKRTMMCGEPREANIGSKITLMGWVQRNRKLGGLEFIDLRDRTGIMQIVFGEEINAESFEKAKSVRPECCIAVTGEVVKIQSPNENMPTGMVELLCEEIKILSESDTPPIYIKENLDAADYVIDTGCPVGQMNAMLKDVLEYAAEKKKIVLKKPDIDTLKSLFTGE